MKAADHVASHEIAEWQWPDWIPPEVRIVISEDERYCRTKTEYEMHLLNRVARSECFKEVCAEILRKYSDDPLRFYNKPTDEPAKTYPVVIKKALTENQFSLVNQYAALSILFDEIVKLFHKPSQVVTSAHINDNVAFCLERARILEHELYLIRKEQPDNKNAIEFLEERIAFYNETDTLADFFPAIYTVKNKRENAKGLFVALSISYKFYLIFGKRFYRISAKVGEEATGQIVTEEQVKQQWRQTKGVSQQNILIR